jgi:hypothetical protein
VVPGDAAEDPVLGAFMEPKQQRQDRLVDPCHVLLGVTLNHLGAVCGDVLPYCARGGAVLVFDVAGPWCFALSRMSSMCCSIFQRQVERDPSCQSANASRLSRYGSSSNSKVHGWAQAMG